MPTQLRVIAEATTDSTVSQLLWDGKDKFKLKGEFVTMGHVFDVDKTKAAVIELLLEWGNYSRLEDNFNITQADADALDLIMEGQDEWHPFQVQ